MEYRHVNYYENCGVMMGIDDPPLWEIEKNDYDNSNMFDDALPLYF